MLLPPMTAQGELPEGVHQATLMEVIERFGQGTRQRALVTKRLMTIYSMAKETGFLQVFLIFGSYLTYKEEPNDVDVVLVMQDEFIRDECPPHLEDLFNHAEAGPRLGASIFWTKPEWTVFMSMEEFKAGWQLKRDKSKRGIVEVIDDSQ